MCPCVSYNKPGDLCEQGEPVLPTKLSVTTKSRNSVLMVLSVVELAALKVQVSLRACAKEPFVVARVPVTRSLLQDLDVG